MKKWIIGIIIFLVFVGLVFLNEHLNLGEDGMHALSAVFVISLVIIFGTRSFIKFYKQEKAQQAYNQTIISQNIGASSYIDEKTGVIYLRSVDYARKSGREWVVTKTAITIKFNNSASSQTTPFSAVQTINLTPTEPIGQLSFSILDKRSHMVVDGVYEDRIKEVNKDTILFLAKDLYVAEAIRNQFAGA